MGWEVTIAETDEMEQAEWGEKINLLKRRFKEAGGDDETVSLLVEALPRLS